MIGKSCTEVGEFHRNWPSEFEDLDEKRAEAAIGDWLFVLASSCAALALNKSFVAVIREVGVDQLLQNIALLKRNRSFVPHPYSISV